MSFNISSTSVSGSTQIFAWIVQNLKIPFNRYDISEIKKVHLHLKDTDFPVLKDSDVTLLIGTDHADLLLHRDFRQGYNGEPTAVKITLGWVLMGGNKSVKEKGSCNFMSNSFTNIDEKIQNFWNLNSYGTLPKMSPELLPPKEKRSSEIQQKTKIIKNNRIETGLLWKREELVLTDNGTLALNRYQSQKKFQKKQDFTLLYRKQIDESISLGHARKLSSKEVETCREGKNYMPYHGALNVNKIKWTNTYSHLTIKTLKQRPRILVWRLLLLTLSSYFFNGTNFVGVQQNRQM